MDILTYSPAIPEDIPFISQVYLENIASLHGIHRDADTWSALLADTDSAYYIVRTDLPVGWFRVDVENGQLWLGMLQVKPQHQRQGIGKYVLSVIEQLAKELGYARIGIHTTEDNFAAQALYSNFGYTVTEIGPCTTADGVERIGYTFEKQIIL